MMFKRKVFEIPIYDTLNMAEATDWCYRQKFEWFAVSDDGFVFDAEDNAKSFEKMWGLKLLTTD